MAPIPLKYNATPVRLAASLGSVRAVELLPPNERDSLDDAFAVLMSCSDTIVDDVRFNFGPPRFWPYTLESAMRMAVAAFRAFERNWDAAFSQQRASIPGNVPADFLQRILGTVGKWLVDPTSYDEINHNDLYAFVKNDVCLDGYLMNRFPETPPLIGTLCIASLYLIDVENCQPDAGPMLNEFNLSGIYSARMPDAIGELLRRGLDESRIRRSIQTEVVPWCLGDSDPLA